MIKNNKRILIIIPIFLLCYFLASQFTACLKLPFDNPQPKTYNNDELIFLKTFYLMKEGKNYYQAFQESNLGDTRGRLLSADIFNWRLPTVFYLWKLTANDGLQIFRNFWLMVFLSLFTLYFLLKKFLNRYLALLGVLLLIPYFADTLIYKTSFLFIEWWSWFFFIFGLTLLIYDKKTMAWSFLFLSVIIRELMIIPTVFLFILAFFLKNNRLFFFLICLFFITFFFLHEKAVLSQLKIEAGKTEINLIISRFHNFDKLTFWQMISFSMRRYPLVKYKSHLFLLVFAFISLLINLFKKRKNVNLSFIFISGWSLLITLPFIVSSQYNDYWGILFMPTLILSIPLIFHGYFK